jgi:hypothetical protein
MLFNVALECEIRKLPADSNGTMNQVVGYADDMSVRKISKGGN